MWLRRCAHSWFLDLSGLTEIRGSVPNKLGVIHDSDRFQWNKYGIQHTFIEYRNSVPNPAISYSIFIYWIKLDSHYLLPLAYSFIPPTCPTHFVCVTLDLSLILYKWVQVHIWTFSICIFKSHLKNKATQRFTECWKFLFCHLPLQTLKQTLVGYERRH